MGDDECIGNRRIAKILTAVVFGAGVTLLLLYQQPSLLSGEDGNDARVKNLLLRGLSWMVEETQEGISASQKSDGLSEMYGKIESNSERRKMKEDDDKLVVDDLFNRWDLMYGLSNDVPPLTIERGQGWIDGQDYPIAPHLQDCERLTNMREASEMRGPGRISHQWLHPKDISKGVDPPWVKGLDKDNMPMTRYMQALLWKHQHARNCNNPNVKFAIVIWRLRSSSGLGSALHVMSTFFAEALASGRILVPLSESFERAAHSGCTGSNYGSFNCYFSPIVSQKCEMKAMALLKQQQRADEMNNTKKSEPLKTKAQVDALFHSDARVIAILNNGALPLLKFRSFIPSDIGEPWADTEGSVEVLGNVTDHTRGELFRKAAWWHAQSIRYMLRWPSKKLCHATNRIRHESYGKVVAQKIVQSLGLQKEVMLLASQGDPDEAEILKSIKISSNSLESYGWAVEEPYIPRPIVSIHIRQGDKGTEMRLFNFPSYMYLAERLRRHVPDLKTVWLSTEMQSIIEETSNYPTWDFIFSSNQRQKGTTSMRSYEQTVGIDKLILLSFANLLIAGECDYFVGVLGSNWNQLINELRLTGGRANAGIVALNYGQS